MTWREAAIGLVRRLTRVAGAERPLRATELQVAADVDGALLSSAAALRRLGATITRYEVEAGRLEARARRDDGGGSIRLSVTGQGDSVVRMRIESDVVGARRLFRRFKRELGRKGQ